MPWNIYDGSFQYMAFMLILIKLFYNNNNFHFNKLMRIYQKY